LLVNNGTNFTTVLHCQRFDWCSAGFGWFDIGSPLIPTSHSFRDIKGEGKRFLHGDLICRYILSEYISDIFCRWFMHYKRKNFIIKSRDFVLRYLFTA